MDKNRIENLQIFPEDENVQIIFKRKDGSSQMKIKNHN